MPQSDHEKNRTAWNEITDVHFNHPDYKVKEFLEGRSTLKSIEPAEVGDVAGKTLLHLMCQFSYWYPPGGPPSYPLMFSLRARKGT